MMKRVSTLVLALCMMLSISAAASSIIPYADDTTRYEHELTISGNTANCYLRVRTEDSRASITATITLLKSDGEGGFTMLKRWIGEQDTGVLEFNKTFTSSKITSGATYRMEYSIFVDGPSGTDNIRDYVEV